jgi:hypothetical protein
LSLHNNRLAVADQCTIFGDVGIHDATDPVIDQRFLVLAETEERETTGVALGRRAGFISEDWRASSLQAASNGRAAVCAEGGYIFGRACDETIVDHYQEEMGKEMIERDVKVTGRSGAIPSFAVCPDGPGPFPGSV